MLQCNLLNTCLSVIHQARAAGEEHELQTLLAGHRGLALVANNKSLGLALLRLKQFVQLLNTMKCVCHTILVCTPLLQSPSVVWSFFCCCPLCLECDAVALCEYEPVLCFGANHFLKRPYRFSFKSKHQKASKENI